MPKLPKKIKEDLDLKQEFSQSDQDDLRIFAAEAELVDLMTNQQGWQIIKRDILDFKEKVGAKLPYLNPKLAEFTEARIQYIAADKLLKMVEDYAENRKRIMELLRKLENQNEEITLDVDNAG